MIDQFLRFLLKPQKLFFKVWKQFPVGSLQRLVDYDVLNRPHYAFCVYNAARLAKQLNLPAISVVEFGVAGGNGLIDLERLATKIEPEFGVKIEVYGFDNATGLPRSTDYRDLPYVWQTGFYKMDVDALKSKLTRSTLVFGDVADTVTTFFQTHSPAPIGAMFVDLDFYTSTRDALKIFDSPEAAFLPRTFCYFDDIISDGDAVFSSRVGELLAIDEYNATHEDRHLDRIAGLSHTRPIPAQWNDQVFVHHFFEHPDYCTYVHPQRDRQQPLL